MIAGKNKALLAQAVITAHRIYNQVGFFQGGLAAVW